MLTRVARPIRLLLALSLLLPVGAACSKGEYVGDPEAAPTVARGPFDGKLAVFAAAPLTVPFQDVQKQLVEANPKLELTYTFDGSPALAAQIQQGKPADVIATSDQESLQKLVAAKLVELPSIFARNKLQIAVAKDNPKKITKLADLARPGVKVALLDAGTPTGKDARKALDNQLLTVKPAAAPSNAEDAVLAITDKKVDAALLYVTDVAGAGDRVQPVSIADNENVAANYRIAVVKSAPNKAAAQAYVNYLVNGAGQKVVKAHRFLSP